MDSRILTLADRPAGEILHREEGDVIQVKRHFEIASCSIGLNIWKEYSQQIQWADIVHLHYPWPFGDLVYLLKSMGKPCVVTYHSDIIRQKFLKLLYRPVERLFLRSVDSIVATSPNYFQTSQQLQDYSHKVDVIPIGIDRLSFPEPKKQLTEELAERYGRDFFLFVGVLRHYKGLHILIDAIVNAPFKVIIAGAGPTEKKLKAKVKKLGLTNVEFVGYVPSDVKSSLYSLCRGVVLPSYLRSEAFGVTLLEGAMSGKPLVSAEIGAGMSHINISGETGLVVKPGCKDSLRSALDVLFEDASLASQLGEGASKRYLELFTGRAMGKLYADLYTRVIASRNK